MGNRRKGKNLSSKIQKVMVYLCLKHIWNHTSHLSLNFFFQMSGQCLHDLAASFCYHDKYLHKLCLMQSKYVVPRPVFPLLTMILSLLRDFLLEKNIIAATENHKTINFDCHFTSFFCLSILSCHHPIPNSH